MPLHNLPVTAFTVPNTYTYNADGTVASTTEAGVVTTFVYNTDGTVQSDTQRGITRTYAYDSNSNLIGMT